MLDPQLAFGILKDNFTRAADRCGASIWRETELCICWADFARFRVVGTDLFGQIHEPFAHLKVDKESLGTQKLTVELWDQQHTERRLSNRLYAGELFGFDSNVSSVC